MPQIDQAASIYFSQLFWLVVIFATIYVVIGRGMLPRIEGTVQARNDRIVGDLAAAEAARDAATRDQADYGARMDVAHKAAHDAVQVAKNEATRSTEGKLHAAQDETASHIAQAELALADARAAALLQIEGVAAEATRAIVARLSGGTVDEGEALAAVRHQLAA